MTKKMALKKIKMAFSLTHQHILDKNIRHIYSGSSALPQYRESTEFKRPSPNSNLPAKKELVRTSEYVSDHKCFIPKAHGFGSLPPEQIDELVTRLRKPTKASEASGKTSEELAIEEHSIASPRYLGLKSVSKAEQDSIVHNLGRPTQMSTLRERSKANQPNAYN
ncbi:hypothetical protein LOTGIDRAFT_232917 [Lottia gigantea]|uniref:Uncharacterized protein n=1 Tax=Lottia gigantea TaxID=225164 RepID=V4BUN2_LOTGI|nr:hypothetical protein LOTGIDRAFT_232917 [Lottia gigantea]ESO92809.1 hypothetical protein LOTGIDRAFT_232917 [Lottia gigantea]